MADSLLQRHRSVMPTWISLYYDEPIQIVRGEGRYVFDADGHRYLDFFGGILTTMVGHAVPEVVGAIAEQAGRVIHSSTLYLIEPMVELAERLAAQSGIPNAKVFFTTSGTEANDAALLLASGYRRSNQVIAIKNSYHGRSFTQISVTGNRNWSPSSFSPLAVSWLQGGSRLRGPLAGLTDAEYLARGKADLEDVLMTTTSGDVAAIIAEPIQGVGGFCLPPDGYFGELQKILAPHGILYISDEVQTGFGRTGEHFWGYEAQGVQPDMITFAKGVGNGMALAGVIARAEIMDSLGASSISTFGGSPVAASAGVATFDYLMTHNLQRNALVRGAELRQGLEEAAANNPSIGEIRGKGLMLGVEFVEGAGMDPAPKLANEALERAKQRGLLIGKGGLFGNVLRIAPPLSVTQGEMSEALAIFKEVLGGDQA
ncbi:aspartate aminotransferase family protein [Ferrimicrobium sp.]|uniref:aspartate aminotransferase family protein n=1 Tax=Ferrimicrobium sp. TaxID=2926050 RepID=UPI00261CEC2D|nr:aspartate aminotransferase family protein [Ferrimicrobium sp.]